jgi:hypothetical protein
MKKNTKQMLNYLSWIVGLIAVVALTYGIIKILFGN